MVDSEVGHDDVLRMLDLQTEALDCRVGAQSDNGGAVADYCPGAHHQVALHVDDLGKISLEKMFSSIRKKTMVKGYSQLQWR